MSEAASIEVLDEVEAELTPPADAAALLLWLDARAERLRELRVRMAQDEAAEKLRRQRWQARRAQDEARETALETDMRNACEAMRATLLPGKAKSRTLPSGASVSWRKRAVRLVVTNATELARWVDAHQAFARHVTEPDMDAIRKHFAAEGELPDGCDVDGGDEAFRITTEGE